MATMAGQSSVLALMLKSRWKTPERAIAQLFPDSTEQERAEMLRGEPPQSKVEKEMVVKGRDGRAINCDVIDRRYARDQEVGEPRDPPIPPLKFGVPGGFGPNTSQHLGQEMDEDDPEMEEKLNSICEALGIDPERDREVYDGIVKRVRSVRARDQNADPLTRVPPVDARAKDSRRRTYDRLHAAADAAVAAAYGVPRRPMTHDAAPRRGGTFEDRFADLTLPNIQG